jgi:hypothetical protein
MLRLVLVLTLGSLSLCPFVILYLVFLLYSLSYSISLSIIFLTILLSLSVSVIDVTHLFVFLTHFCMSNFAFIVILSQN